MPRVIFTNHAKARMQERRLSETLATQALLHPDRQHPGKKAGTTEFVSRFDGSTVTVIAFRNDQQEWVVVSAWIDPPFPGTKDARKRERYREYQLAGWQKKLWMTVLKQLGVIDF